MTTIYICNSMQDIAAFIKMFPKACWSNQSLLSIDDNNYNLRKSLPIALHKTPNTDTISWSAVHNAAYHLQALPQKYQLGALQPLLDLTTVFVTFLKQNNAYDKYVNNFDPECCDNTHLEANTLITGAFHWPTSPESNNYWQTLNSKWEELLKYFDIDPDTVLAYAFTAVKKHK